MIRTHILLDHLLSSVQVIIKKNCDAVNRNFCVRSPTVREGKSDSDQPMSAKRLIALTVDDVNGSFQFFFSPKIWSASVSRPGLNAFVYEICFAQFSRRVGFETIQDVFRFRRSGYHRVHMIERALTA